MPPFGPQSVPPVFLDRAESKGITPACRGADIRLFFPDRKGPSTGTAKAICKGCALLTECREYALSVPAGALYGVWGGLSQEDRFAIQGKTS